MWKGDISDFNYNLSQHDELRQGSWTGACKNTPPSLSVHSVHGPCNRLGGVLLSRLAHGWLLSDEDRLAGW